MLIRPTIQDLIARIEADFKSVFGSQLDPALRRSVEKGFTKALAGASNGLHGYIEKVAQQLIDPTEERFLVPKASLFNITRLAAVKAAGTITAPGTNGSTVPAGTVWQRNDGTSYRTNALATVTGGVVTMACTAETAGVAGNCAASTPVTLAAPVAGVSSSGTVAVGGMTGGADIESLANLRTRYLERRRTTPRGGGTGDYVAWAREVSGVTRAWEYANFFGPNTVGVAAVLDDDPAVIPDSTKRSQIQTYVQAKAPITTTVTVLALTAAPLNPSISVTPDTPAIRLAVEAELKDMVRRTSTPGGTTYVSVIREAISLAEGEQTHNLVSPAADVTHTTLEFATLGTISWV